MWSKCLFSLIALSFFSIAQAQAIPERSFEFRITPSNPGPGEEVRIFADTFSFDATRAETTWRVNGEVVEEGNGIREITVQMGEFGDPLTIEFSATRGTQSINQTRTILPSLLDLVVEPQTYAPALYPGGTKVTHESPMRITAIPTFISPEGSPYASEDIVFTWREGTQVLQGQSGRGAQTALIDASTLARSKEIVVDAATVDNAFSVRERISIRPQEPELLFYEDKPLLGIDFSTALAASSDLDGEEVTIVAEPFFVPGQARGELPVEYTWRLNNESVASGNEDGGTLTLRQAGQGRGRALVNLSVQHVDELLIRAENALRVTFGSESPGIFGL